MTLKCTYPAQIALLNSSFFYQLFITFSLRYFTNFSNLFYPEGISWVLLISRFRALYRRCYFLCLFLSSASVRYCFHGSAFPSFQICDLFYYDAGFLLSTSHRPLLLCTFLYFIIFYLAYSWVSSMGQDSSNPSSLLFPLLLTIAIQSTC